MDENLPNQILSGQDWNSKMRSDYSSGFTVLRQSPEHHIGRAVKVNYKLINAKTALWYTDKYVRKRFT